jgi:hypothetical protein
MLKRILKKKKLNIIKSHFFKTELKNTILLSFSRNKQLSGLDRISFLIKNNSCFEYKGFFSSYQKLLCFFTNNHKVPSRDYNYSRFFLNFQFSKIILSNTYK